MFLAIGLVSSVVGIATFFFLPNTPMDARFLSAQEKRVLLHHVAVNKTGISNHRFETSQLKAVFTDPQIWLLFLTSTITMVGSSILATFGTTIIRGFGFSSKQAALLSMPGGLVLIFAVLLFAYLIRYEWLSRFWSIIITLSFSLMGTCLVAFVDRSNKAAQLAGMYMVTLSAVRIPFDTLLDLAVEQIANWQQPSLLVPSYTNYS